MQEHLFSTFVKDTTSKELPNLRFQPTVSLAALAHGG